MTILRVLAKRARLTTRVLSLPMLVAASLQAGEIHDAAAAGDLNRVRAFLEADPTLLESKDDRISYRGNTPLISACWGPPANIPQGVVANYLIDKGANINARNTSRGSPLYFAHKDYDLAQRLIDKGADVNARAYGGLTPLHQTAATGNLKVAKLLIDHGAELNSRSNQGSILHTLIIRERPDQEMAKLLIESGAKLQEFSFGNTELHLAAMKGFADLAPILVKHGADVNAVNEHNHTALYYAARHGHRRTAEALIAAGANKSAIVETNYGKAPQLTAVLKEGEAYLWYLGSCAPCDGYAVKTKNHLLIFNPSAIDESPEAGLANGRLNPTELAGQKVTVLMTHRPLGIGASVSELAKGMPGADFVLNFKPSAGNAHYHPATPNESFSIDGIQAHTIPAMLQVFFEGEGLGYLVEADGVKIFHPGLHVSGNEDSQLAKYRKEIDFLKPFGSVDIVILPIKDRHIAPAYEPYLYLLDQLSPRAVYLAGADIVTDEHSKVIKVLGSRNAPMFYPEGGIAMGERFHYLRDRAEKPQPGGRTSASSGDAGSQVQSDTRPRTANYLELQGAALSEITRNSASIVNSHVSIYVDRLGKSGHVIPEQTVELMAAGKTALGAKDYYRAYRLQAKALGWAYGEDKVEHYEVAASLTLALNRAIFSGGENITLTLRPLFTLGHPLTYRYTAQTWLETESGVIPGTAQTLTVTELKEYHFDHPVKPLLDGVIAVCYRLVSPAGETLAELKHAVVVAKDLQIRLEKMKANFAAARIQGVSNRSAAFVSALETVNYNIRSLEQERSSFEDGNTSRSALPLGKYLIKLNWTAIGRPVDSFPQFDARLRYPQDVDFAESLITALAADPDALLTLANDMALAAKSTKNDELLRYRIFVPEGYDRIKKHSLIVALHSGGGDGEFFEFEKLFAGTHDGPRENGFKQIAQQRGYILVSPNGGQAGFFGERGEADVLDIVDRVRSVYSIDPNRVFLTGWSGGSEACWRIATKYPRRFGAAAPVGVTPGISQLLTPQNAARAGDLPVLYSAPGTEAEQGRLIGASAKVMLRNFTYTEYLDADHAAVWLKALPAIFDFFDTVADTPPIGHKASFQGLGDFPGGKFESRALRVSADGSVVVGNGATASGEQAFCWTESEGMVGLGNLPDGRFKQSWAVGVSADGSVIAGYGDPDGSGWNGHQGFLWTRSGGMVGMGSLKGSTRHEALGVSADGAVVVGDGGQQAFRWTQRGGVVGLGTLPGRTNSRAIAVSADGSVVVGSSYNLPSWDKEEAFVWTQAGGMEGLGVPSGRTGSFPNAISADGSVIAGTISGAGAFRWSRSTGMTSLGHFPGAKVTHPSAVTAGGEIIIGTSFIDRRAPGAAFIWDATHGMRSLQAVLATEYGLDLAGWTLENASGITPDGLVIVGWGKNPAGHMEAFRLILPRRPAR